MGGAKRSLHLAWANLSVISFGSAKQHLEDRDKVNPWNVGKLSHLDMAVCPGTFH